MNVINFKTIYNGLITQCDGAVLEPGPLNFTDRARWYLGQINVHSLEIRDD
jgi:hypothetical protein